MSRDMAEAAFNAAEQAYRRVHDTGREVDPQLILALAYAAHALALCDTTPGTATRS